MVAPVLAGTRILKQADDVAEEAAPAAKKGQDEAAPEQSKAAAGKGGWVDSFQSAVDAGTLTSAGVGVGAALTGYGVAVTALNETVGNIVELANVVPDLVQAGVAVAEGDFAEAGKQLKDGGLRAAGAVPVVGIAVQTMKAAKVAAEVVEAVVKKTQKHPAFMDLRYSAGIKDASLRTLAASDEAMEGLVDVAERIKKGDTEGTLLARFGSGSEGVNDFYAWAADTFVSRGKKAFDADEVAELGAEVSSVTYGAAKALTEPFQAALAAGKLSGEGIELMRKVVATVYDAGNSYLQKGILKSAEEALGSAKPEEALKAVIGKAELLSSRETLKRLSDAAYLQSRRMLNTDPSPMFEEGLNQLMSPEVTVQALRTVLARQGDKGIIDLARDAVGVSRGFNVP